MYSKKKKVNELQEGIFNLLFNELEPYRPTHAKDWAEHLTDEILTLIKEAGWKSPKFCHECGSAASAMLEVGWQ